MLRSVSARSLGRFRKSNISTAPAVLVRGVKLSIGEEASISSKCSSATLVEQRRLQSSGSATGTHSSAPVQDDATKNAKKFRGRARGPKKFRSNVENDHLHLRPSGGSDGGSLAANAKGGESVHTNGSDIEQEPFSERTGDGHVRVDPRRRLRGMKRYTVNPSVGVFVLSCEGGGIGPEYGIGAALKSFCGNDIILPSLWPTLPMETSEEGNKKVTNDGCSVSGPHELDERRQQPPALPTEGSDAVSSVSDRSGSAPSIASNTSSSWTTLLEAITHILGEKQPSAGGASPSPLPSSAEDAGGSSHATKSSSRISSIFRDLEHLLTFESLPHSSRGEEGFKDGCLPLSALSEEEKRILDLLEMLLGLAANPSLVEPHANGWEERARRGEKGSLSSSFAQPPSSYVDNRPAVFEALLQLASFTETQFLGKSLEGTANSQESIQHDNIDSTTRRSSGVGSPNEGLFGGGLQRIKFFFFGRSTDSGHQEQALPTTTDRRDSLLNHRGPSTVRWFVHCRVLCSLASVAASLGQHLLASLVIKDAIRPLLDSIPPSANTRSERGTNREEEEDESTTFDSITIISTQYDHTLLANRFKMSLVHMFTLCAWCNVAEGNTETALLFFEEALGFAKLGLRASVERGDGDGFNGLPLQFTGGFHFPSKRTTQETSDVSLRQDHHRVMVPLSYADICLSYASFVYNGREYAEALEIVAPLVRWLRAKIENRDRIDGTDTEFVRKDCVALQRALLLMGRCVRKGEVVGGTSSTRSYIHDSADEDSIAGLGFIQGLTPAEEALRLFEEAERIGSYLSMTAWRHHTSLDSNVQLNQECRTLHTDGKNAEEAIRRLIAFVSTAPQQSLDSESVLCITVTDTVRHKVVTTDCEKESGAVGNTSSAVAAYEQALVYHYDYVIPTASTTSKQPTVALGRRALACYDRATAGLRGQISEAQKQLGLMRKLRDVLVARAMAVNEVVGDTALSSSSSRSNEDMDSRPREGADAAAAKHVTSLYQATITTTANVILSLEDTLKDLYFTYAQMLNDAAILHEGLAGAKVTSMCPNFGAQNAGGIYREALRALEAAGRTDVSARVRLGYARSLLAMHNLAEAQQQCGEALAIVLGARGGGGANEDEGSFVSEPLIAAYAYRDSSIVSDRHTTAPQLAGDRSLAYLSAGEVHAHIAFIYQYCVPADSDDALTAVTILAERHYLQALDYSGINVDAITYEGVMRRIPKAKTKTTAKAEAEERCLGEGTAADDGEDAPTSHVEPTAAKSPRVATHFSYAPISPIPMEEATIGWMLENFAMLLMNLPREFSLASKLLRTRIILAEHGGGGTEAHQSSSPSSSPPMLHHCISAYTALAGCMEQLASHGMGLPDAIGVFRALLRVPAAHFDPLQKYELVRRYAAAAAQVGEYATAAELFAAAISLTNTCPELYIQYAQCLGRLPNYTDIEHLMLQYELALAAFEMHEAVRRRRGALDSVTTYQGNTCGLLGMSSSTLVRDLGLAEEETQLCSQRLESVLVSGRTVNDDLVFDADDKKDLSPPLPLESLREPETLSEIFNSHPSRAIVRFDDYITRDSQTTHLYDPFYVYSETALFLQTVKMDYSAAEAAYKRLLKRYDSSRTSTENYSQTLINYALLKQQHTDDAIGARILFAAAVRVDPTRLEARLCFAEFLYTQQSYAECLQQVLAILDPSNSLVVNNSDAQYEPSSSGGSTFVLHPPQGETEASAVSPEEIMSQLSASSSSSSSSSSQYSSESPTSGTPAIPQKTHNLSKIFAAVSRALSASPLPPLIAGAGDGNAQQQQQGGGGNPPHAARLHSLIGALKSSIAPDDAVSVTESFLLAMGVDSTSFALTAEEREKEGGVGGGRQGGLPEPMIALLEALRTVPDPAVPLSYLAYLTGKTMHFGFARSCYAILCERFPSDPNVLISAAHFYGDVLKEKGTARKLYLKAMRLDPENVNTISSCAIFLMTAYPKRFEEIDGLFKLAMELAAEGLAKRDLVPGEDGVPISTAAAAAARKHRFEKEQLIKKEESAGTAAETYKDPQFVTATDSYRSGEAFEGVEDAASSQQEGPELMDLGVTLNYLSFLTDYRWSPVASYRLFQRALRCFPKCAHLHATYGAFLDRYAATVKKKSLLGTKASAPEVATDLSTNIRMPPTAAGHAAIKALAKEHFLTAIRLSPNKAIPYLMHGSSLSRQRKYAESISYLQHAARLEPSNETVLESCANVLFSWYSHLVSQQGAGAVGSEGGGSGTDSAASTASTFSPLNSTVGLIDHNASPLLKDLFPSSNLLATDGSGSPNDNDSNGRVDEPFPSYDPYTGIGHQPTGSLAEIRDATVFYYRRLIALNPTSLHYLSSYARFITEGLQNEAVGKRLYDVVAAVEASRNRARRESKTMMLMVSQQHHEEDLMSMTRLSTETDDATEGDNDDKRVKRGERPTETPAATATVESANTDEGVGVSEASGRPSTVEEILAAVAAAEEAKKTALWGQEEQTEDLPSLSTTPRDPSSSYTATTLSSDGLKGRPSTLEEILAAVAAAEAAKAKRLSEEAYEAEVTVVEEDESPQPEDKVVAKDDNASTTRTAIAEEDEEEGKHKKGGD